MAQVKRTRRRTSTTKKKPTRNRPRVEDTEPKRSKPRGSAQHRGVTMENGVPMGANGLPAMEIINQGSELVPVAQFANVTVGPIAVRRYVEDPGMHKIVGVDPDDYDEEQAQIAADYKEVVATGQALIEEVIAEDREAVEESVRKQNSEKDKK